jgi:dolichol-phosphate mannosyltransferase
MSDRELSMAPKPLGRPSQRVLAMFPFLDEAPKLQSMARRLRPGLVESWLGVDNGSTDDGAALVESHGIPVISQPKRGVGCCIRTAIRYARANGYQILVVMAGNDKDDPEEIPSLLAPILRGKADYVQGSRFLEGGSSPNLPFFRWVAIKLLSSLFRVYSGTPCTDLTNGFRAYKLSIFDDARFDIEQQWLNAYEFEYYLHWKVYQCGYRVVEVPVTKTYPAEKSVAYTKIQPVTGWWQMLRPFLLLALGIKK